jgi:hypothetical protein
LSIPEFLPALESLNRYYGTLIQTKYAEAFYGKEALAVDDPVSFFADKGHPIMKIGITCYPTYGGSGVVATEIGKELAARGHEIHFISYAVPIKLIIQASASISTKWRC